MQSRSSWVLIFFVVSYQALSASALHNGFTHIEAGSWTIRNAVRLACNRGQGESGYRKCLADAVKDINKSNFVAIQMNDYCPGPCQLDKQNVALIKNCFNTVSVVNKGLPWKKWHANLYEDIMVGCLTKEHVNRIVHFGPGTVPNQQNFKSPYKISHLRKLLQRSISGRKDLQARIEYMVTNLQK